MSQIARLLVSLGVSYALMNREEFTERFSSLFEKYEWDEEKLKNMAELFFVELEHWRDQKDTERAFTKAQEDGNEPLLLHIKKLSEEIAKLSQEIQHLKKA